MLPFFFLGAAQSLITTWSGDDWIMGSAALAPDGSVAVLASHGDPARVVYLFKNGTADEVDLMHEALFTESIAVLDADRVVIGDAVFADLYVSTKYMTFVVPQRPQQASWAFGGMVAMAPDGVFATLDPHYDSFGAVIVGSDVNYVKKPTALAMAGHVLAVASENYIKVYKRTANGQPYQPLTSIGLEKTIVSVGLSPDGSTAYALYEGIGLCTPCFLDKISLATEVVTSISRSPSCGGKYISAFEGGVVACGEVFAPPDQQPQFQDRANSLEPVAASADGSTFLYIDSGHAAIVSIDSGAAGGSGSGSMSGDFAENEASGSGDDTDDLDSSVGSGRDPDSDSITNHGGDDDNTESSGMSHGAVVGIALGSTVGGLCLTLVGCKLWKSKVRDNRKEKYQEGLF